jgi:AraC-like DNA-binding protein
MTGSHDRASGIVAPSSGRGDLPAGEGDPAPGPDAAPGGIDPLSDVLRNIKLTAALFFMVDATAPWCVDVPHTRDYRSILLRGARHLISYHVVVEGGGFASVPGRDPVAFETGDILVFPHGDAYRMESAPGVPPEFDRDEMVGFFRMMAAGDLPFVVPEGGGGDPPAKFICGFLGCDARPFNPLLAHLPRLLRIRRPAGGADLLGRLVDLTIAEVQRSRSGGACVRLGLSELLFVEAIRRHLETLPGGETGWLAGLRDPVVGRALAALHGRPRQEWSLETLAREAGISRSVLSERFAALVGQAPMGYLANWRMQLAARLLADTDAKIGAIAFEVGYRSEAAFSRSFKKIVGVSPAIWRREVETPLREQA